jgi:signal transduction histidine kinase
MISLVALVAVVGARGGWRLAAIAFAAAMALMLLVVAGFTLLGLSTEAWPVNLIVAASNAAFAVIVVGVVRQLIDVRRDLDVARTEAEAEHARRLWAQERARIAREMHDVVAHSMSVVHMRATSARFRLGGLDAEAAAEFDAIGAQARTALAEMRDVLGLLRDDDAAPRAPQPGLADLPSLVGATRGAGVEVDIRVADAVPDLPPSTQLALYRVAQESLSNVVRHAPGSSVELALTLDGEIVELLIVNGPGTREPLVADAGGHGLRGMLDRVTSIGGTLETDALPDGGFRVRARVPRRAEAA